MPPSGKGDDFGEHSCEATAARGYVLDGDDDYLTMGEAPELGLATFTLEAWVRREGRGAEFGTGVGGLRMVPLVAKGRGESDGSNVDCNYALGIVGEVLGADFEDAASGRNHPVLGKTALQLGRWHHVAATYDGSRWRLYLDGELDAETRVDAAPRADSIQHFAIGSALNSEGLPIGHFAGSVDEVRVWSRALSEDEIRDGRFVTAEGDGLVSRWDFESGTADTVGESHGEPVGGEPGEGIALDRGGPPEIAGADHSVRGGGEVTLDVRSESPADLPLRTRFYLRRIDEEDEFTIAVMPDSKYYTRNDSGLEDYFLSQTSWIASNSKRRTSSAPSTMATSSGRSGTWVNKRCRC